MINVDRNQAIEYLNGHENLFLTGDAGSGKTYLIREFAKTSKKNIALTATTGVAALNIGGETIHRFLSLGITTRPEHADIIIKRWIGKKRSNKNYYRAQWDVIQNVDTIIIDEVSMLRRDQFELIDVVLSAIRNDARPFGGIQMILVGDFFQLPPVVLSTDLRKYDDLKDYYAFQSILWDHADIKSINLTTNYRHSDASFSSVLNAIRLGRADSHVSSIMRSRLNLEISGDIKPVKLYAHKADVEKENLKRLKQIDEPKYRSVAEYYGKEKEIEALKRDAQADDKLYFCKGAQIVMLANEPNGLYVNGSMGKVEQIKPLMIRLADGNTIFPQKFTWEKINYKVSAGKWKKEVVAKMVQYPFRLCYSSSIHKSQGLTLDCAEIDISKCFAPGQAYVALSRVRSLDGLVLSSWSDNAIMTDKRVLEFYSYE